MRKTKRQEVIEECARECERTAETVLEAPLTFVLNLGQLGTAVLHGPSNGSIRREQLASMAKILRGMR